MLPPRIVLTVADDNLLEREFIFEEPGECIIGRAPDCDIQIPPADKSVDVSRHHCVLEMHPPFVQVRDLGSLNGTYVNGRKIGQRPRSEPSEDSGLWPSAALALHNGDELRIGGVNFHVRIAADAVMG
jgi:pSer/pThr/pTyr-binding forkhead associated (FHA) protein